MREKKDSKNKKDSNYMDKFSFMDDETDLDQIKDGAIKGLETLINQLSQKMSPSAPAEKKEEPIPEISKSAVSLILRNVSELIVILSLKLNIYYVSPSVTNLLGYKEKEAKTKKLKDVLTQDSLKKSMLALKENINYFKSNKKMKGSPETLNLDFIRKNRTILKTEAKLIFLCDDNGSPEGIIGIIKDMDKKEIHNEEEEKYSKLFSTLADAVLIYDLEGNIIDINHRAEEMMGYSELEMKSLSISDIHPPEALEIPKKAFERVKQNGFFTFECILVKKNSDTFPAEVSSKLIEINGEKIIQTIIRDISERKVAEDELKKIFEKLRESVESTIMTIAEIVEKRDPYTAGHQKRVTHLACAIAQEMKLDEERIKGLRIASMVHDVGKLYISADTLAKSRKLTDVELSLVKIHPKVGYDIIKPIEFPWPVAEIVLQHHELCDGSGYPEGLESKDIMLEAKILTVADIVEAMSAPRPYRPEAGLNSALEEISKNKDKLYDQDVVDACVRLFREKKFNF